MFPAGPLVLRAGLEWPRVYAGPPTPSRFRPAMQGQTHVSVDHVRGIGILPMIHGLEAHATSV